MTTATLDKDTVIECSSKVIRYSVLEKNSCFAKTAVIPSPEMIATSIFGDSHPGMCRYTYPVPRMSVVKESTCAVRFFSHILVVKDVILARFLIKTLWQFEIIIFS